MNNERRLKIESVLSDWYTLGKCYGEILVEVIGACDGVSDDRFNEIIDDIEHGFLHQYSRCWVRIQNKR